MEIDYVNDWPVKAREAVTTDLVGLNARLDGVDYLIEDYDAAGERYLVRRLDAAGTVAAGAALEAVSFPSVQSILVY